ncbi:cytochrome C oxidase subunit I [Halobacteriales archaeon QS_1_68_20]|nr:MAG: cytochrome C oxidase subunit I [Halobacteriales archaeon QS_1_68_20]
MPDDNNGDDGSVPSGERDASPESRADGGEVTDGGHAVREELPAGDEHGHDFPSMGTVKRWLVTTNHKDVGILYTVTSLFFLVFGGLLALLFRLELTTASGSFLTGTAYNQAVTAHGLLMVFFFLSPFAFGFANYFVPLQLGAKDLAFPRLNALSYWLYLLAGGLFGLSFLQGSTFAGGWTMYAPLNLPMYLPEGVGSTTAVMAMIMFVISVTVSSVNFLTTMHRMRAEGMRIRDMPLFSMSILLTVWMMLFAFAALLAALIILASDHILGTTYFAATEGGSLLWAHLFWFFGHPEVYIVFFPALGMMAEVFQTFTGRRIVGRKWFIAAMTLVALQSFVVWMHHMFLTSINLEIKTLFMATTIGISLPFDLMVFALIYTMIKGRIRFTTPFLFAFGALLLFIVGGITGVFLGAVVLDYEFRGTYWVVAHFHYVMVGGAMAMFGALYYWYPKMTGKMYDEFLGKAHFALSFVGFNLLYFPQFVAWETPRRVYNYQPEFVTWHQLSTVGAFVFGLSFLLMFYNFYKSYHHGEDAGDAPWKYASSAEWAIPSPPSLENFPGVPSYKGGSLSFLSEEEVHGAAAADGGPAHGHATGDAHAGGHDDHASYWPLLSSVAVFVLFVGLAGTNGGGTVYTATAALGGLALLGTAAGWVVESFHVSEPELASRWPFDGVENTKLGVWIFLASDVVVFGAFVGSYIFIRVAEGWQNWHHLLPADHVVLPGLINTYLLLASSFSIVLAMVAAEKKSRAGVVAGLVTTLVLGIGFLINKGIEWSHFFHIHSEHFPEGWTFGTNVASSTFYLTTGMHGLHVTLGLLVLLWMIPRAWRGAYTSTEDGDKPLEYFGLYWHFVDIVWLFLFPLFYIL